MGAQQSRSEVSEMVVSEMTVASDTKMHARHREAALRRVGSMCHTRDFAQMTIPVLCQTQNTKQLLGLMLSRQLGLSTAAFGVVRSVSSGCTQQNRAELSRDLSADLLGMLAQHDAHHPRRLEDVVAILANLLAADACRSAVEEASLKQGKGAGPADALMELLGHADAAVQVHALRALTALGDRASGRRCILQCSILPIVRLCCAASAYGDVQHNALQLLARLTNDPFVRKVVVSRGVLAALAGLVAAQRWGDAVLTRLVATVFSNFSQGKGFGGVDPSHCVLLFSSLMCSPRLDGTVQGLWATANAVESPPFLREFIESDGLKIVFAVLHCGKEQVQVWYEVARIIANIASGSGEGHRSDEEKEFLVREGAVEALVQISGWCMEKRTGGCPDNTDDDAEAPDDDLLALSARHLCLVLCTRALRHLTTYAYVSQLVCDLGGLRGVMRVLDAECSGEGKVHAVGVVANITQHAELSSPVLADGGVLHTLVHMLRRATDPALLGECAYAVGNIAASSTSNADAIAEEKGTAALLRVLKMPGCQSGIVVHTVRALTLLDTDEARHEIIHSGGLTYLMHYAMEGSPPVQRVCAAAIRQLAEIPEDVHLHGMVREGVLVSLITLLRVDDVPTQRDAALAVSNLTRLEINKVALVEQSGMPAVAELLHSNDKDLLMYALGILGNMSTLPDTLRQLPEAGGLVRRVCEIITMNTFALILQASRCLSYLTDAPEYAAAAMASLPAGVFVGLARSHNATLQRYALQILTNLARCEAHSVALRVAFLPHRLADLLRDTHDEVVLNAVRCLAQVARDPESHDYLLDAGVLGPLVHLARHAAATLGQGDIHTHQTTTHTARHTTCILEAVLAALKAFAAIERGADVIVHYHDCLPLFVQCLDSRSLEVRREVIGCLESLARFEGVRRSLQQEGGAHRIVTTLQSSTGLASSLLRGLATTSDVLASDTQLKQHLLQKGVDVADVTVSFGDFGLAYEERTDLMTGMGSQLGVMRSNVTLQTTCLRLLFNIAATEELQVSLLELYSWTPFLAPLEMQDHDCQLAASMLLFRLLEVPAGLATFIESGGVSPLLRALEFEEDEVKDLASAGIATLSRFDPTAFRAAVCDEGGVSLLMEMIESAAPAIKSRAYATLASLCMDLELGEAFLSQGVLTAVRDDSDRGTFAESPAVLVDLVGIVSALAKNEAACWKVLEKGGATLLFNSLLAADVSVVRAASQALLSLLREGPDVCECYVRCPASRVTVQCIEAVSDPQVLGTVLQVFAHLAQKSSYREWAGCPAVADTLLARLHTRDASDTAPSADTEEASAQVLRALTQLLPVSSVVAHLARSEACLQMLVAASQKAGAKRALGASAVLVAVLELPESHDTCVRSGLLQSLASMSKEESSDCRTQVARCLEMLAVRASDEAVAILRTERVLRAVKALLGSSLSEVRVGACHTLLVVLRHDTEQAAKLGMMSELSMCLRTDHQRLLSLTLSCLRLLFAELGVWLHSTVSGTKQTAREQCEPCVPRLLDVYRRSQQGARIGCEAFHTLNILLALAPDVFCPLLDVAAMLDFKRAVTLKRKPVGTTPPRIDHGRSNLDIAAFRQAQGSLLDLEDAGVRVQSARVLCFMSAVDQDTELVVQVLKAVSLEDLIKLAHSSYMEGEDVRYTVLLLRLVSNCLRKTSQRYLLSEDRTGLLKLVYDLTAHHMPQVVEPAALILATVSWEPAARARLLSLCGVDPLARLALTCAEDCLALCGEGELPPYASALSNIVTSLCRLLSCISDGSPAAARCVKEASDLLCQLEMTLPACLPDNCKYYIRSALTHLDDTLPRPATGISASFPDLVAAARDRMDTNRVQKSVGALYTLCRDSRNHVELLQAGAAGALCPLLRSPVTTIFRTACWALIFLSQGPSGESYEASLKDKTAKERATAAEKRAGYVATAIAKVVEEGIAAAVKAAQSPHSPESARVASRLLAVMLQDGASHDHLKQCGAGTLVVQTLHFSE